jgi:hypothetical protein
LSVTMMINAHRISETTPITISRVRAACPAELPQEESEADLCKATLRNCP